jgi:hypothetical protein
MKHRPSVAQGDGGVSEESSSLTPRPSKTSSLPLSLLVTLASGKSSGSSPAVHRLGAG